VFLIWDKLSVHRVCAARGWLTERQEQIEVFRLPAYYPELNLKEGLNADRKQAVYPQQARTQAHRHQPPAPPDKATRMDPEVL
jgi:hypothetical protein